MNKELIEKRKDKLIALFLTALAILSIYTGYRWGRGKFALPTIEQVQEYIGAEVDGKLGPETQKKWEIALMKEGE